MKTKRHISLARLHLLLPIHYHSFFHQFVNLVFVLSARTDNINCLFFLFARSAIKLTFVLPAWPGRKIIPYLPARWKNHLLLADVGQARVRIDLYSKLH